MPPKNTSKAAPAELITVRALSPLNAGDGRVPVGGEVELTQKQIDELLPLDAIELIPVTKSAAA